MRFLELNKQVHEKAQLLVKNVLTWLIPHARLHFVY